MSLAIIHEAHTKGLSLRGFSEELQKMWELQKWPFPKFLREVLLAGGGGGGGFTEQLHKIVQRVI